MKPTALTTVAVAYAYRAKYFVLIGILFVVSTQFLPLSPLRTGIFLTSLTFLTLALVVVALNWLHSKARLSLIDTIQDFVGNDAAMVFFTDSDGRVVFANPAAKARFGDVTGKPFALALRQVCEAPASVLYRLQSNALAAGAAHEDVEHHGGNMRLSGHCVGTIGFVWRIEVIGGGHAKAVPGDDISLPMMTVSDNGTILFMNEALRVLLGGRETTIDRVFTDLPLRSGEVHHLASAEGALKVQVIESELTGGRREVYLRPATPEHVMKREEWGVIESLPVALLKLDRDGRIATANQRARTLLNDEDAIGSHLADQVEGLGRPVSDWLSEAWAGRHLGRVETVRAAKAEERFLQISLEELRDEDGPALVAVLSDATELKALETQFVQSQKMQAIGQLAGGVAHDFNNLLTAISGHCDLLLLRHDESDPDYADLSQISQNANRAAALVGQLLAFSRKQTLRPEVLDLTDTLGDLTHLLGRLVGERVKLDFTPEHDILPVRADKRQLEQVLMNLVVNARDAMMPDGGKIRLLLNNVFLEEPLQRDRAVVPAGDYVTIRVVDEGNGIRPDHLDKIFEPFFTTKRAGQGTGLGLSMVYGIVKQSGGFIFADSEEGKGATFTLYFPVYRGEEKPGAAAPAEATQDAAEAASGDAAEVPVEHAVAEIVELAAAGEGPAKAPARKRAKSGKRAAKPAPAATPKEGGVVLLVEDEAPVRAFASRALRLKGFTVLEAGSAEEALKTLEDDSLEIDVVVTDVIMPGMDGPTWVAEALGKRPGVKVVFMSGYAEDSVSEHQARIPNSVFLPKPFSLSELTDTVSRQLH